MQTNAHERIKELSAHFSKRSGYWEEIYSKRINPPNFMIFELDRRMNAVLNIVDNFASGKKLKILDAGCGSGHYIEQLLLRGHNVFGIDVAYDMLKKSNGKYLNFGLSHKLSLANTEKLPFKDEDFDIILFIGVIEYLPNISLHLKEIYRTLKKDGILVLSAPNLLRTTFFLDPYYIVRGWKFIMHKIGLKQVSSDKNLKDVSLNADFRNKRFRFKSLLKLFNSNNLIMKNFYAISFGPISFFLKPIFNLKTNIKLSLKISELSNARRMNILKKLSNRWVFELQKLG